MISTTYSRFCRRLFADVFKRMNISETNTNKLLEKADIGMMYDEYYSMVIMNMIIGFVSSFLSTLFLFALVPNEVTSLMMLMLSTLVPVIIGMAYIQLPVIKAKSRGKNIDRYLPYVANFINTMSTAGISPSEIFGGLSSIDLYGEVQKEAKKITTEIELMGIDTITALQHAIEISPSRKFTEFLQGIVGVIQSGSDLKPYFERCVDRYMFDDMDERKKNLESLAIMAESFVVTVIAFPLFLVIIISIMGMTSSGGMSFDFLYMIALVILPMAYVGFYVMMKSGMGEDV